MPEKLRILVYGAGAIGSSVYGWIAPRYKDIILLARGDKYIKLQEEGLILSEVDSNKENNVKVTAINSLDDIDNVNVIILSVKNYDLEKAAQQIYSKFKNEVIIVALQNGVENQNILTKYFNKIVYGVICFNVWQDNENVVYYKEKGPLYLGTEDNKLQYSIEEINGIFNLGFKCEITDRLQDAVHTKIVLNLSNSLFTLVGLNFQKLSSFSKLSLLSTQVISEGIKIIQKAGYKEHVLGSLPNWKTISLSLKIPSFLRTLIFKKNVKHAVINSMAQDLIMKKRNITELDTLNGYILQLAQKNDIKAPYNKALYDLSRKEFSDEVFEPLSVDEAFEIIISNIK